MGAVALVAGRELRRRWRRVVVLTLLVAALGGLALATAAGARRTTTALSRFKASSRSADIELDAAPTSHQLRELNRVPGVAGIAVLHAIGVVVPSAPDFELVGAPTDSRFGTVVDRFRIVAGRTADPSAVDEITAGEGFAARLHLHVGDHLEVTSYSTQQIAAILGGAGDVGKYAGPNVRLHLVGIVRQPLDLGDRLASGGLLVLTPAFDRAYAGRIGTFGSRIRIRTERGEADVPRVLAASRHILGHSLFSAQGLAIESQGASNAIDLLSIALWIGAALTALAGAAALGIVMGREIALLGADQETLLDLGCTRGQRVLVVGSPAPLIAGGGALLAVLAAVGLSPLFPLGVARRADPNVGLHADWTVLLLGVVAVAAVVLTIGGIASVRATRRSPRESVAPERARKSTVAERGASVGLAPSVTNGLRMALERGRGRSAVPVRSAFAGAIVGVLAVTAAFVFTASLDHLVATPRMFGSSWDFQVSDITSNTPCGGSDFGLTRQAGIAALAEVCSQNVEINGRLASAVAFTNLRGDSIGPGIVAGRAPRGAREVALGAKTLHALGKHVGDEVDVTGRAKQLRYRIVGRAVFPTLILSQPLADGAAFTGAGYAPIFDQNLFNRSFVGRFAAGADHAAVEEKIRANTRLDDPSGPLVPVEVSRLHQITWLPLSAAVLLGVLALLAVGHTLVTAVRRRRRELAVLKTLGFVGRQVRATVAWQATTLGAVGLVLGIPLGVIMGEFVWRLVAEGLGVATAFAIPARALVLTIPAALIIVNVIAFFPARGAARTRAAVALRSE